MLARILKSGGDLAMAGENLLPYALVPPEEVVDTLGQECCAKLLLDRRIDVHECQRPAPKLHLEARFVLERGEAVYSPQRKVVHLDT